MAPDEGLLKKKHAKSETSRVVWKSMSFIIFIVFICQKFNRIPLLIGKYINVIILIFLYYIMFYKLYL